MSQGASGLTGASMPPPDMSVGYTGMADAGMSMPAGYTGATSAGSAAPATPQGIIPPSQGTAVNPGENLKQNLGFMQKFANLLGKDPDERAKNAKVFAAMVKDLGNVGKAMSDSTLMQRMMSEQMNAPQMLEGGGAAPNVGAIAPSAGGGINTPVMATGGFTR